MHDIITSLDRQLLEGSTLLLLGAQSDHVLPVLSGANVVLVTARFVVQATFRTHPWSSVLLEPQQVPVQTSVLVRGDFLSLEE